jgi:hypothetical protein
LQNERNKGDRKHKTAKWLTSRREILSIKKIPIEISAFFSFALLFNRCAPSRIMPRTAVAELPLHGGHCPRWLFPRMADLGGAIAEAIVFEFGQEEFLRRMADPFFFQSLGCVLGFDWHSSGLTTTVCGALKEGIKSKELGIAVCGGKGKTSRQTPTEIEAAAENFSSATRI